MKDDYEKRIGQYTDQINQLELSEEQLKKEKLNLEEQIKSKDTENQKKLQDNKQEYSTIIKEKDSKLRDLDAENQGLKDFEQERDRLN